MSDNKPIETVPAVVFEGMTTRYTRLIRRIALAWGMSVVMLTAAIVYAFVH